MCSSRKYPYPLQGGSLEILRGWGVTQAKHLKGKYGAKLEFPEGSGDLNQKSLWGGVWILTGTTQCLSAIQ